MQLLGAGRVSRYTPYAQFLLHTGRMAKALSEGTIWGFCTTLFAQPRSLAGSCSRTFAASGAVITWEGRLDNREDLLSHLPGDVSPGLTDLEIVAAAYENWRNECFGKLVGDWALAIFDPQEHAVILAKDFLGTRPLYYSMENHQLAWCSILDPLLLLSGRTFALNEEYIAGWLSLLPCPTSDALRGYPLGAPVVFYPDNKGNM